MDYTYDNFNRLKAAATSKRETRPVPLSSMGRGSGFGPSNSNRGNLTSVSRELFSEGRSVETHTRYETVGNVVESEDPNRVAIFHTHPDDRGPQPSPEDMVASRTSGVPIFSFSRHGIWVWEYRLRRSHRVGPRDWWTAAEAELPDLECPK